MPELHWSRSQDADPGDLHPAHSKDKAPSPTSGGSHGLADRRAGRPHEETTDQLSPDAAHKQEPPDQHHHSEQDSHSEGGQDGQLASMAEDGEDGSSGSSEAGEHTPSDATPRSVSSRQVADEGSATRQQGSRDAAGAAAQAHEQPKRKRRHRLFGRRKQQQEDDQPQQLAGGQQQEPNDNQRLVREVKGLARSIANTLSAQRRVRKRQRKQAKQAEVCTPRPAP